jgi:hypothetical protein
MEPAQARRQRMSFRSAGIDGYSFCLAAYGRIGGAADGE